MLFVQRFPSVVLVTVTCVFLTCNMSIKYIQKTLAFGACSHDTEGNSQQRPALSASGLKTPSLNKNWYPEHKSEKKKME